ncbi:MAG: hypothetical protein LBK27_05630 [Treponema sp.]|nr:hypothetical protein [Treponema sp.]
MEGIKKTKELINYRNFEERIDSVIDAMGINFEKPDNLIEEIFTDEELEYICISGIIKQKFNGKEYYVVIYLDNNEVIAVDENKMIHKIGDNPNEI